MQRSRVGLASNGLAAGTDALFGELGAFGAIGGKIRQVKAGPGKLPGCLNVLGLLSVLSLTIQIGVLSLSPSGVLRRIC